MKLQFEIVARCNTRACQYNARDMHRAMTDLGLEPERQGLLMIVTLEEPTREFRFEVERAIKRVHHNAPYRVVVWKGGDAPCRH